MFETLETAIVDLLKPLVESRRVTPYCHPEDYDNKNLPANGLGFIYVAIKKVTAELPSNKRFGHIVTQPVVDIELTLYQRGGLSHKYCYPTIEQIVNTLNGTVISQSPLIFTGFEHLESSDVNKYWKYKITFSYVFDLAAAANC
jgi:hypothetical protein